MRSARSVMSSKFPIGVATTDSVPIPLHYTVPTGLDKWVIRHFYF
jgi:hypothetical protein